METTQPTQGPDSYDAYRLTARIKIYRPDCTSFGEIGDWLLFDSKGTMLIVKDEVFRKSVVPIEDGESWKKAPMQPV